MCEQISHSRQDHEHLKWRALRRWAREFQREHGRWPLVWYDRACLECTTTVHAQQNIAALPLFVTGCQQLLVLAGSTYVGRLWALVEILAFLWSQEERIDQISVLPLLRWRNVQLEAPREAPREVPRKAPRGVPREVPRQVPTKTTTKEARKGVAKGAGKAGRKSALGEASPAMAVASASSSPSVASAPPPEQGSLALLARDIQLEEVVDVEELELLGAIEQLDVASAACTCREDRQLMLAAIESTFGTTDLLNARLRFILCERLVLRDCTKRMRKRVKNSLSRIEAFVELGALSVAATPHAKDAVELRTEGGAGTGVSSLAAPAEPVATTMASVATGATLAAGIVSAAAQAAYGGHDDTSPREVEQIPSVRRPSKRPEVLRRVEAQSATARDEVACSAAAAGRLAEQRENTETYLTRPQPPEHLQTPEPAQKLAQVDTSCVICLDNDRSHLLYPCGHWASRLLIERSRPCARPPRACLAPRLSCQRSGRLLVSPSRAVRMQRVCSASGAAALSSLPNGRE